jgi:hypothetical protein
MSTAPAETRAAAPAVEPMLSIADLAAMLNASRRTTERLKSAGKLPKPDLHVGKMPRWKPETVRSWIDALGGRN